MNYSRIWIDVDGVLADFVGRLLQNYNAKNGTDYNPNAVTNWQFSKVLKGEDWKNYMDPDFWTGLKPYPWAQKLVRLVDSTNILYAFLTSLPNGTGLSVEGRRTWLNVHLDHNHERLYTPGQRLVEASKKELVVRAGDLVIEDSPDNARILRAIGADVLLLAQPWNEGSPGRMTSDEILTFLRWLKAHVQS